VRFITAKLNVFEPNTLLGDSSRKLTLLSVAARPTIEAMALLRPVGVVMLGLANGDVWVEFLGDF
jgi:hypothetical protein